MSSEQNSVTIKLIFDPNEATALLARPHLTSYEIKLKDTRNERG